MAANHATSLFASAVEEILRSMWEFYPNVASGLGLHEYDGKLPDISKAARSRRARELERQLSALGQLDAAALSRQDYFDHKLLLSSLNRELFELTELRAHEINPMRMMWAIEFSGYVNRGYAPLEQRVQALTSALRAVPSYLDTVKANLTRRLSKPYLESAIESYQGIISFYDNDLTQGVQMLGDRRLQYEFDAARGAASQSVGGFVQYLKSLQSQAIDDFSIGARKFSALLKHGEMVELPLERLLEVGNEDLARNLARFRHAASQIDPCKSPVEVMAEVARDHPSPDELIPRTKDMLEEIRQYLIDQDIVGVPSEVRCQTTATPSFMRWAFAAMDLPGPFETKADESFYYVTPVEGHWSDEHKEQWLTSFSYATLKTVSVHEAYPGHYVQFLHAKSAPSKISQVFSSYSFSEGWAHYAEEMMIEQGYGAGDPRLMLGQLSEALLRNCRYVCAIRMHTQSMTVDEATRFFMDNAYMEELPARKEAMRGTFDPMYLNYTLGKLMILKLREDYRSEQRGAYSLRKFHDTLLSFGAPPIPLIRDMMLRNPGRDVL